MHCRLGSSYSGLRSALLYPLHYLPLVFGTDPMLLDKNITYMEYTAEESSRPFNVEGMGAASLPLVPSSPGYTCHCNAKAVTYSSSGVVVSICVVNWLYLDVIGSRVCFLSS